MFWAADVSASSGSLHCTIRNLFYIGETAMSSPFPIGGFSSVLGQGPYATRIQGFNFANPFGKTWFVDGTNGSDGNDGTSGASAFKTVPVALKAMLAGDTLVFAPGTYTIAATITPLANTTFIAGVQKARGRSVVLVSSGIATLIDVEVNGVSFYGMELKAGDATLTSLITYGITANAVGLHVVNCSFNGNAQTGPTVGIQDNNGTFAGTAMVVSGCHFVGNTGTCINIGVLGMGASVIDSNVFSIDTAAQVGIALADTTAFTTGKGWVISNNRFIGFAASALIVGISIAGTENTVGAGVLLNNYFAYCVNPPITAEKLPNSFINNYVGDDTAGGTLVNPT